MTSVTSLDFLSNDVEFRILVLFSMSKDQRLFFLSFPFCQEKRKVYILKKLQFHKLKIKIKKIYNDIYVHIHIYLTGHTTFVKNIFWVYTKKYGYTVTCTSFMYIFFQSSFYVILSITILQNSPNLSVWFFFRSVFFLFSQYICMEFGLNVVVLVSTTVSRTSLQCYPDSDFRGTFPN